VVAKTDRRNDLVCIVFLLSVLVTSTADFLFLK